jgi:transglutaminase-like putative cysteine protease
MKRILWQILGTSIWLLASGLAAWRLTVPGAALAALVGSLAGIYLGARLASSRLRLLAIWGLGILLVGLAACISYILKQSFLVAASLSPSVAFTIAEIVFWFFLCLAGVAIFQSSSRRAKIWIFLEIASIGGIFAGLFSAHRGGFINRPYFLVDPVWARGYDPVPVFLAVGVTIALLLLLLTMSGSGRRSFRDLALLCALLLALFLLFPLGKLKDLNASFGGGSSQQQSDNTKKDAGQGSGAKTGSGKNSAGNPAGGQGGAASKSGSPSSSSGAQNSSGQSGGQESLASFADQQTQQENAPVAVVLLHDDYDPPSGYFYFRQTAFSQYNGQRLIQDTTGKADLDLADAFPAGKITLPEWPADAALVKPIQTSVALMMEHPRPFALVNPQALEAQANPDPTRFYRSFRVTSSVLMKELGDFAGLPMGSKNWSDDLRRHYTERPGDPRYRQITDKTMRMLKPAYRNDPFARAAAIKFWLEENGAYSLASNHEKATNPLADFLFGDLTGHCVYFAHSACLLFRAAGVPARVGAGYAVNARNRGGGAALLVRAKDAHAWPEIYLEGAGWVVMDIAPKKNLEPPEDAPDPELQQMLGEMARQDAGNPKQEQEAAGKGDLQKALRGLFRTAGIAVAGAAVLLLLCLYGIKLWRRWAPHFCAESKLPRVAYRACLDGLADMGRLRAFGQTREAFARKQGSPAFETLTSLHLEAALGAPARRTARGEYLSLVREAAANMAGKTSLLRRLAGAAHPASWLMVK